MNATKHKVSHYEHKILIKTLLNRHWAQIWEWAELSNWWSLYWKWSFKVCGQFSDKMVYLNILLENLFHYLLSQYWWDTKDNKQALDNEYLVHHSIPSGNLYERQIINIKFPFFMKFISHTVISSIWINDYSNKIC